MLVWLLFLAIVKHARGEPIIVCNFQNGAQYRPGKGEFLPEDIDYGYCTHILYSFLIPKDLNLATVDNTDNDLISRITKMKLANSNLKVFLTVGGDSVEGIDFSILAMKQAFTETFALNVVTYLRSKSCDGLAIDWRYPAVGDGDKEDMHRFTGLLKAMHDIFQTEEGTAVRLMLVAFLSGNKSIIDNAYELDQISGYVDYFIVQTYDYYDDVMNRVKFTAALHEIQDNGANDEYMNMDWTVKYYLSNGIPKKKLNVAIVGFSRSFTLGNPKESAPYSAALDYGKAGAYTGYFGMLTYYEACDLINSAGTVKKQNTNGKTYLVKGDQWVGLEDVQSVQEKACYAVNNGLAGVTFMSLDTDDFSGDSCGQDYYPLLRTISEAVVTKAGCIAAKPLISDAALIDPDERLMWVLLILAVIEARTI